MAWYVYCQVVRLVHIVFRWAGLAKRHSRNQRSGMTVFKIPVCPKSLSRELLDFPSTANGSTANGSMCVLSRGTTQVNSLCTDIAKGWPDVRLSVTYQRVHFVFGTTVRDWKFPSTPYGLTNDFMFDWQHRRFHAFFDVQCDWKFPSTPRFDTWVFCSMNCNPLKQLLVQWHDEGTVLCNLPPLCSWSYAQCQRAHLPTAARTCHICHMPITISRASLCGRAVSVAQLVERATWNRSLVRLSHAHLFWSFFRHRTVWYVRNWDPKKKILFCLWGRVCHLTFKLVLWVVQWRMHVSGQNVAFRR